jgi:hypothetical protein
VLRSGFAGPIPASVTALTRLVSLYAAPPAACGLPAESGVRIGTLRRRELGENRFSGSVPATISALTALTYLCVLAPAVPRVEFTASRLASAGAEPLLDFRSFYGNRLEGRLPPSLLAMRFLSTGGL